jgi:TRAP-type C4-dicarboxylate transport system permease small subunit
MNALCLMIARVSAALDRVCRSGAVAFFVAMLAIVALQVLGRYVFRVAPVWTEEAARYCMVWGGLLGATVAFKAGTDPRLIKPPQSGPKLWVAAARALRGAAVLVFLGPVLYYSYRFLIRHWDRTAEALGISTFWVSLAVPLVVIIIFIHLLAEWAARRQ